MTRLRDLLRRIDAAQQRHTVSAVVWGVQKKFGDDNAGNLIVQLTYAGFVTVFPLLLLLVTILGLVLSSDPSTRQSILHSTLSRFPIVGKELGHNIHALKKSSTIGLIVALLSLTYGCFGLAGAGIYTMSQVWNVPGTDRPGFLPRLGRSATFLVVLGVGAGASTFLAGIGTFGSHQPVGIEVAALAGSLLLNCGQYLLAMRVLAPKPVPTRSLWWGSLLGGAGWTVLQSTGSYLVGHTLKGDSATYGTFAIVLGLLAWLYMGARLFVYACELNVVLARHLWPRALVQPPLTEADKASLAAQAEQNRRRPEQQVEVSFDDDEEQSSKEPAPSA